MSRKAPPRYSGLLLVDKPKGCTSHDVVDRARRALRMKKIGHCGTLDPSATGLLVLTIGKATRLSRFLTGAPKIYTGDIRFGISTDTYDAVGEVTAEGELGDLDDERIARQMAAMIGRQEQLAPAYSAKKIDGKRSYELARAGKPVPERRAEIEVYDYSPRGRLDPAGASIGFRLECSAGTYARTLAHDLGQALGCGAHLSSLRRIETGPFAVQSAVTLDDLMEAAPIEEPESLADAWTAFDDIPLPFSAIALDLQQVNRIHNGQTALCNSPELEEGDWVRASDDRGTFVAVAVVTEAIGERGLRVLQPKIVFR